MDINNLLRISTNLEQYGRSLAQRDTPPDADVIGAMGQAFVEIAEAIDDIASEFLRQRQG